MSLVILLGATPDYATGPSSSPELFRQSPIQAESMLRGRAWRMIRTWKRVVRYLYFSAIYLPTLLLLHGQAWHS